MKKGNKRSSADEKVSEKGKRQKTAGQFSEKAASPTKIVSSSHSPARSSPKSTKLDSTSVPKITPVKQKIPLPSTPPSAISTVTSGSRNTESLTHSRQYCPTFKHSTSSLRLAEKYCSACICYVCEVPAEKCSDWAFHCLATDDEDSWFCPRDSAIPKEVLGAKVERKVVEGKSRRMRGLWLVTLMLMFLLTTAYYYPTVSTWACPIVKADSAMKKRRWFRRKHNGPAKESSPVPPQWWTALFCPETVQS